ncbi:hypothetical protein [Methylobacterium thuringiense]|uniref:hypothetical protein n=1 Tax=Methylobacterium thuringiense TaxID=1003091 RepID=UPI001EDCB2A4|nr:hypothetical protein [Methylobacterium thuringiense]
MLQARVEDIDRWLSPSRDAAIVRAVELMRGNLVIANNAGDDAIKGYISILRPFPEPVVERVCQRFMDGRLGNRTYAPMPAEVAHECRLVIADTLAERGRIALILDAEVYASPTEADQAKIAARHAEFVAETTARARMPAKAAPEPPKPTISPAAVSDLASRQARREIREAEEATTDVDAQQDSEAAA